MQTEKGLELVFKLQFLYNFLIKFFLFQYDINWPNFINITECVYFPSNSLKCISGLNLAFDDFMEFEYLKFQNLIFSRTKKVFEVK